MDRRGFMVGATGLAALAACSDQGPSHTGAPGGPPPISADETTRTIALMRPPKRRRALVAIVADNRGAETTDLMIPYGALTRCGLVDVRVVAPDTSPIQLMPALRIRPQLSLAAFDHDHPDGADYVVVPAQHYEDSTPVLDWIRAQARSGATIVGVCSGAKVLGRAGLLDHHRATTHWSDVAGLRRDHPTMTWVADRRYVADRGLITTTGVTASLPVSLALVEAIGGPDPAVRLAAELGVTGYDPRHVSSRFAMNPNSIRVAARNAAEVWGHETIGAPVSDGVDEIALAFTTDAFSRTYRSRAVTTAATAVVRTRGGLELLVDRPGAATDVSFMLPSPPTEQPARALDDSLTAIAARYGDDTAGFVALQLEYPWRPAAV